MDQDLLNYVSQKEQEAPTAQAHSSIPVDPIQVNNANLQAYVDQKDIERYQNQQSQYGTPSQQALAGVEGFGRGASLGTSDYLTRLYSTPEDVRARAEANPLTSGVGSLLGGTALLAGTGGLGGLAAGVEGAAGRVLGEGLAGKVASGALGTAAEGAVLGGGNVVSDLALGDPDLSAQKVLAEVGMPALFGAGLGALSTSLKAVPAIARRLKGGEESVPSSIAPAPQSPEVPETPLDKMQSAVDRAKTYGGQTDLTDLPEKQEMLAASDRLGPEMGDFAPTDWQKESFDSEEKRWDYGKTRDVPGRNGNKIRNFESGQKKTALNILDGTIENLAPEYEPTSNLHDAGERATEKFTDAIQNIREQVGPLIKELKETPMPEDLDHLPGVVEYLTNKEASSYANPKLANVFDLSDPAVIKVKPAYSTSMGVDRPTYRAMKELVSGLKENPESFEKLFDVRKGIEQGVDLTKSGDAARELSSAKAAMMDYIQDAIQKVTPDAKVREAFQNYAINEKNANIIERTFGAKVGENFRSVAKGPPEKILDKIFSNSDTVQAAHRILGDQSFKEISADYLKSLREQATSADNVFSPKNMTNALDKSQYALEQGMRDVPSFQKIKDALTVMRILPDRLSINPSSSATTWLGVASELFQKNGFNKSQYISDIWKLAKSAVNHANETAEINAKLAGTQNETKKLGLISNMLGRVDSQIKSSAKAIFSETNGKILKGAAISGANVLSQKQIQDYMNKVHNYYANPQSLLDDMAKNTEGMHQAAPNVTQGVHTALAQATSYLKGLVPPQPDYPIQHEWKPNFEQQAKFNKAYSALHDPVGLLKDIKKGVLSVDQVAALGAVYPQLAQEMRKQVVSHMKPQDMKKMPYPVRQSLSLFLGQPLDASFSPQNMMSNQAVFQSPSQSTQNAPKMTRSTLSGMKNLKFNERAQTREKLE